MSHRVTLDFFLHDWLQTSDLCKREFHAEHNRETFDAVLDLSEQIAKDQFAPINRLCDVKEPEFDGTKVHLPAETAQALAHFNQAGLMAASKSSDLGGMQLPTVVEMASMSFFYKANVALAAYPMLTRGNANTILAHGTHKQIQVFAKPGLEGRTFGTMCLSEPQAGSSLSDILTKAVPDTVESTDWEQAQWDQDGLGKRYRLTGNKMWISGGEHEMGQNIIHLVLAKIPDANGKLVPGVKGISLFIVPRKLVDSQGKISERRNDVSLAGLNHKCGYRGTVNTLLNFGEGKFKINGQAGAIGYLIGEEGKGLNCMFTLMNEARIAVGLGASMLGLAGFEASLDYAKQRPQGRSMGTGGKDHNSPQIPIIEHTDVKRMLLAQKAISEGGLALALYCARLVDEDYTGNAEQKEHAQLMLELLTPIAKSWPSEWAQEANSLAIQVLGGYGYTRDFPVEQYWRDNRLNMIHEGTHGIQALDLLGRKVLMKEGKAMRTLLTEIEKTTAKADLLDEAFQALSKQLNDAAHSMVKATQNAWSTQNPQLALANATPYLQAFGHLVLAWIWLDIKLASTQPKHHYTPQFIAGKQAACDYFFAHELPKIQSWLSVVNAGDTTCLKLHPDSL